ncbi:PRXIIC [Symbiodinium sp. KB8]|nr:PRXIIC [Symbiodinium sp. KB8]
MARGIAVGTKIPSESMKVVTGDEVADAVASEYFAGKKVVLVGIPGAFTGTCYGTHIPDFVQHADEIKAKGADAIAVLGVNDFFVMKEFAKALGAGDKLSFIADGNGTLTAALDASVDFSGAHFGTRTTRFSAVVEDGTVTAANVESDPGAVAASDAATILKQL